VGASLRVDLKLAPSERWHLTQAQRQQAQELLSSYGRDLGLDSTLGDTLVAAAQGFVRKDHLQELEALARLLGVSVRDAVIGNLYYDIFKFTMTRPFGCTAFAVETESGILHARNLDWWTENAALARYTAVTTFESGPLGEFKTIGWPGFTGALSGVANGRFAVTLNAVLSLEPAQIATPITFLLRTTLEEAPSFEAALKVLSETPIPCDCLLLLTGTRAGELAVIERTPTRHAVRWGRNGYICVTNDYQLLSPGTAGEMPGLQRTSCARMERIDKLFSRAYPRSPENCLRYLSDPQVRMPITVQQMAFRASTGQHWLKLR
jgi:acid ceramidase